MKRFCIVLAVIASCLWVSLPLAHTSQSISFPDFDQNSVVDFPDFLLFVGKFGSKQGDEKYEDRFDLDGNGAIDFSDFLIFVNDFGKASPDSGDENDVNIPDANLRAVIADSLGKARDEAISRAEMATLTRLEARNANISDLTGLQFATNLTYLRLTYNAITDLSALCDLTNLTRLILFGNAITNISALSNLTNLIHLNLTQNTVSDISVLANLTNLKYLFLADNTITDTSALSNLTNLTELDMNGTSISDISALSNLTNLTYLQLANNTISDIAALANLTSLTHLEINHNCIADLSAISNLSNLTHLNFSDNRISDFSPLVANTGLGSNSEVNVRNNPLSDESLNTHIPALQRRGVNVQFDDQPVLLCVPVLPQNLSIDAGTSHTLQANYLYVDQAKIRPESQRGYGYIPAAVVYADFNDDGHIDIFYGPLDDTPHATPAELYLNDGTGCFTLDTSFFNGNPPGLVNPRKALPGDFNGDGRIDVFVLGHGYDYPPFPGEAPYVILSSPDGYVLGSGLDTLIGGAHGGASGDIDADGDIDVFVTHLYANYAPYFLINGGNGTFTMDMDRAKGFAHKGLYTAELVDVDGDGFLDLLAAGAEFDPGANNLPTQILWGDNTGVFSTAKATILPRVAGRGIIVDIDVSDTDEDGDKDIIINRTGDPSTNNYRGYYVQLVEQVGTRRFEDKTAQISNNEDADANWILWIRMCDCNGDGYVDIVVDNAARNLIWENDGTGTFRPR